MNSSRAVASNLPNHERKRIAMSSLSKAESNRDLANREDVSRQFVHRQKKMAMKAIDEAFSGKDDDVLFYLPVTQAWLNQLVLALVLICHSSFRGVKELLRDLFDVPVSIGTIHNRIQFAAEQAAIINRSQNLSAIRVGLLDEIFQGSMPVLACIDASSTFCLPLKAVKHRDGETWALHLREAKAQGFAPDFTVADGGTGLRAGQKLAYENTLCHGDIFHPIQALVHFGLEKRQWYDTASIFTEHSRCQTSTMPTAVIISRRCRSRCKTGRNMKPDYVDVAA